MTQSPIERSRELAEIVKADAERRIVQAITERDLYIWLEAQTHLHDVTTGFGGVDDNAFIPKFDQQWGVPEGMRLQQPECIEGADPITYTLEDFLRDNLSPEKKARLEKEIRYIREMYAAVMGIPEQERHSKVVLRRFRAKGHDDWRYRALAVFPAETSLRDNFIKTITVDAENSGIIYFGAQSPCVNHACDMLYKQSRNGKNPVYCPVLSFAQFDDFIREGKSPEFMDPATRETRDPAIYLAGGLHLYFSNELQRFRIPRELLKTLKQP